jgi:2-hydroxychromene-2-carboxylate isomerase
MRIENEAALYDISVVWKPFLLMPIMIEQGMKQGPFLPYPKKLDYMWRDLERRAKYRGLQYKRPSVYPPRTLMTARIGLLASQEGWCPQFSRKVFHLHFVEDKTIGTEQNLMEALSSLGKEPTEILEKAQEQKAKEALRQQTERAKDIGLFGSPSFMIGSELFWGDDRLEDALQWCVSPGMKAFETDG